jgi:hypothetical protein
VRRFPIGFDAGRFFSFTNKNLEETMAILGILGWLLLVVGVIWLTVIAYKTAGALWAVIVFILGPLGGLIFCIMKKTGWMQWLLQVVGWILMVVGGGMAAMTSMPQ